MALVSGRSSALNPNAPLFIPAALRQVEDFSPQWWELVKSSTWFHDYWLSQRNVEDFEGSFNNTSVDDIENMLPENFDLGIEEDFNFLENEFEHLVLFSEAQDYQVQADPNDGKGPLRGVHMDAKALLEKLTPKSPKERHPKSSVGSAKHLEKPALHANIKRALQRIQQPR
ncbi:hypothetical protein TanjilG_02756 [Lupinus angustifolius]|uniref:Ataxin-2 C-terminal domain-containing protein n=1 Tax=Lupinus angustifolius TaxID=3871 RepID=A0A1J7IAE7_LUPAN|nr:PREDICTED: protein EARLY RESPONSIVE TO DEHYDRATION 15-like [Lupinus angustifolius]OIW11809.1 hypothetical protein TanjilG_02756 [Lupinus angustifolius]